MTLVELATLMNSPITLGVSKQWTASLRDAEIKDGRILESVCSCGDTARQALQQLVSDIRGKRIVVHAVIKEYQREFVVPDSLEVGDLR